MCPRLPRQDLVVGAREDLFPDQPRLAVAGPGRAEGGCRALEREREVQKQRVIEEGKPPHIAEKIVEGRLGKFYEDQCLLEQKYVKDDTKTVREVLTDAVARIGENIRVRRFVRFVVGEGLEKKNTDFASEVAAQLGR